MWFSTVMKPIFYFQGDNIVDHAILHLTDWPHTTLDNQIKAHLDGLENLLTLTINTVFTRAWFIIYVYPR